MIVTMHAIGVNSQTNALLYSANECHDYDDDDDSNDKHDK